MIKERLEHKINAPSYFLADTTGWSRVQPSRLEGLKCVVTINHISKWMSHFRQLATASGSSSLPSAPKSAALRFHKKIQHKEVQLWSILHSSCVPEQLYNLIGSGLILMWSSPLFSCLLMFYVPPDPAV